MATQIEVRGADVLADRLQAIGREAPFAVLRALRRTRTTLMTRVTRGVSAASGVPVRRIRRSLHGSRPSLTDPEVRITLWAGREPLVRYHGHVQREIMPRSAFRATMPSGHTGIFERRPGTLSLNPHVDRARSKRIRPGVWHTLPIDEAYGPQFTRFVTQVGLDDLKRHGGEVFKANLGRELAFRERRQSGAA